MMDIYTPVVRAGGAPGATTGPGTGGTANPVAGGTPGATAAATQPPGGWPLVVALPGGPLPPGARQSLEEFGSVMAMHGVVIMAADWRESPQFGGGYPISFEDVGCAIRYARSVASTYGADPAHVTLAAHSFGGFAGAVVSLSPTPFVPPVGECAASSGSTQPDAYVGIAPISSLQDMSPDLAQSFLGGTRAEAPAAWAASDPLELAAAPDAPHLPITLVVSTSDLAVPPAKITTLADALTANGRPVQVVTVSGPDHTGILIDPHTVAAILAPSAAAGGS
jgi:acetyl esterase/lipase